MTLGQRVLGAPQVEEAGPPALVGRVRCPGASTALAPAAGVETMPVMPVLSESDAGLLYLVIILLYHEGVVPTAAEVLFKLKEHNASPELCANAFVHYLLQEDTYLVCANAATAAASLTAEQLPITCFYPSQASGRQDVILDARYLYLKQMQALGTGSAQSSSPAAGKATSAANGHHPQYLHRLDVAIYLREVPNWWQGWTNPRDPCNPFGPQIWSDLADFFTSSPKVVMPSSSAGGAVVDNISGSSPSTGGVLPLFQSATRYGLAKALKACGPPSIRALRLGDIIHLIQLTIRQGYLVYDSGSLLPAWASIPACTGSRRGMQVQGATAQEMAVVAEALRRAGKMVEYEAEAGATAGGKLRLPGIEAEALTELSTTCGGESLMDSGESPAAGPAAPASSGSAAAANSAPTLADVRRVLVSILESDPRIILSQIRDLFSARYQMALNPGDFGYAKLSELLTEQFSDVCVLVRLRNRHVFVERLPPGGATSGGAPSPAAGAPRSPASPLSSEAVASPTAASPAASAQQVATTKRAFLFRHARARQVVVSWLAQPTFASGRRQPFFLLEDHYKMRLALGPPPRAHTENWSVNDVLKVHNTYVQTLSRGFPSSSEC